MPREGVHSGRFLAYSRPVFAPEMPTKEPATPKPKRPQLEQSLWPATADHARHESLHDLAIVYGMSHETIRAIVRRTGRHDRTVAAAD
jgi:hypothetical protein